MRLLLVEDHPELGPDLKKGLEHSLEARLIHTIMNLADDAIRYTDPGGRVTVSVEERRDQGIHIRA